MVLWAWFEVDLNEILPIYHLKTFSIIIIEDMCEGKENASSESSSEIVLGFIEAGWWVTVPGLPRRDP